MNIFCIYLSVSFVSQLQIFIRARIRYNMDGRRFDDLAFSAPVVGVELYRKQKCQRARGRIRVEGFRGQAESLPSRGTTPTGKNR